MVAGADGALGVTTHPGAVVGQGEAIGQAVDGCEGVHGPDRSQALAS